VLIPRGCAEVKRGFEVPGMIFQPHDLKAPLSETFQVHHVGSNSPRPIFSFGVSRIKWRMREPDKLKRCQTSKAFGCLFLGKAWDLLRVQRWTGVSDCQPFECLNHILKSIAFRCKVSFRTPRQGKDAENPNQNTVAETQKA
jgi:hypothetical protein